MRIVHFGDNHLGAGSERREGDILDAFAAAVEKIIALKPDLVVNAGDLFDAVRPSNQVLALVSRWLIRLGREAGLPTVIIAGNHDAPKQKQIGPALEIFREFENIHVVCQSRGEKIVLGDVCVTAVPHCLTPEILKEELTRAYPDPAARYNVLLLHGVAGDIREFKMADLAEQAIDPECFERGFDYVALGHYHNFTRVAPIVYYCGSTERLSMAEAGHPKGFIEVDLAARDEKSRIHFHPVQTRDMLDLPAITARGRSAEEIMAQLEQAVKNEQPENKIIRVRLTDISEETYRALPFDRIAELKKKAFSLDLRIEKAPPAEPDVYADINLGRLDQAFEKFLAGRKMDDSSRQEFLKLAVDYLHRAETDEK